MTVLDFSLLQSVTYDQSIYSHFLGELQSPYKATEHQYSGYIYGLQ